MKTILAPLDKRTFAIVAESKRTVGDVSLEWNKNPRYLQTFSDK